MQFQRHEIRTGLLVLFSLGILFATILYLTSPGFFRPITNYGVFFATASGLKQGAPVQLAGRNIGTVTNIVSPIPQEKRPAGHDDLEVMVEVTVDKSARIYNRNAVRMQQIGMLGDFVVDFSQGDQTSGLAQPQSTFLGERQIDFNEAVPKMLKILEPVAAQATKTFQQLQETAANLKTLTDKDGELNQALANFNALGENLAEMTGKEGPLNESIKRLDKSLADVNQITGNLVEKRSIEVTLQDIQKTSQKLNSTIQSARNTIQSAQNTITGVGKGLDPSLANMEQFTDTLKHQPWRLIWPTTKKYPEDTAPKVYVRRAIPVQKRR